MSWSPVRVFVVVALVVGGVIAVMTPGFTGYDEPYHFVRAWELSNLQVHSDKYVHPNGERDLGARFPKSLYTAMSDVLLDSYYAGSRPNCHGPSAACAFGHIGDSSPHGPATFIGFAPSAVYAPVPYIPAAVAIRVARALGLSTLVMLWLARLFGLLAYVLIVALAITRIPRAKSLLAVVALAPVCVFQAATVSADGITIALALLAVALALRLAQADPELLPRQALVEVGLLAIALGLAKPPYLLFLLLFVPAIVRHRHELLGRALALVTLPGVALFVWWSSYAQSVYLSPSNPAIGRRARYGYAYVSVDQSKQLTYVQHHPGKFLGAIGTTIQRTWRILLHDTIAQIPGWNASKVVGGLIAILAYAAVAIAAVHAVRNRAASTTWLEVSTTAIVAMGTFVALFLLAYTGWNAVGAPRIDAFQGRYLFPVLALAVLGIAPRVRVRTHESDDAAAPGAWWSWAPWVCTLGALAVMTIGLILHYY